MYADRRTRADSGNAEIFTRGDKVALDRTLGRTTYGRVIGWSHGWVTVAYYLDLPYWEERHRLIPHGTPIYFHHSPNRLRRVERDPGWDPYSHKPLIRPSDYRVLAGDPRWPGGYIDGLTQVGAYIPAAWYRSGDPCWAWSEEWHAAEVMRTERSWVAVRYVDGFKLPRRGSTASHRPPEIWPVLNDFPELKVIRSKSDFIVLNKHDARQLHRS